MNATLLVLGLVAAARSDAGTAPEGPALDLALASSRATARAVARVRDSIVTLRALGTGRDGYGAGILVREDGMVLTARHVVKGAAAIAVLTADGREFPGRVVGTDGAVDLALVRIVAPGETFPTADFGDDEALEVGETVLAISNPFGLGVSVSRGLLSARDRRHVVRDNHAPLLQTDAAINPGSSGGALVNLHGEVVGLITAILTRSGGHEGVGFAVPTRELRRTLPFLLKGESRRRPWLGVRVTRRAQPQGGLKITSVVPEGPAARAGLRAGDVLLSLQGRDLRAIRDLRQVLEDVGVGETVVVELRRGGEPRIGHVVVGTRGDLVAR